MRYSVEDCAIGVRVPGMRVKLEDALERTFRTVVITVVGDSTSCRRRRHEPCGCVDTPSPKSAGTFRRDRTETSVV